MGEFQLSPSDNILKLRKLTEQICNIEPTGECIIETLKILIDKTNEEILVSKTEKTKLKHYEKMFSQIKKIINEN
jgi:hypothetical protein